MRTLREFAHQSETVQEMARTLGVDLGQAILDGKMLSFPIQDVVYRCSKCREKDSCQTWLDLHKDGSSEAPEYCRNKVLLERLRNQT